MAELRSRLRGVKNPLTVENLPYATCLSTCVDRGLEVRGVLLNGHRAVVYLSPERNKGLFLNNYRGVGRLIVSSDPNDQNMYFNDCHRKKII